MMMKRKKTAASRKFSSYYVKIGDTATARIARAIKKKSFLWGVLELAWTAGPITLIALCLGHFWGLGSFPSVSKITYFIIYTLVMGLSAILASLFRNTLDEPKIETQQKCLLSAIDKAHLLILHARNLHLSSFHPDERKIFAAFYSFQSAGSSMDSLKLATWDLTNNQTIVNLVERNITLYNQGMTCLIHEELEKHQDILDQIKRNIRPIAPVTFDLFEKVTRGIPPRMQEGREREEGFIQRVLNAATNSDLDLMTLYDAYESLSIIFEFLNGRKIETLEAKFSGNRELEKFKKSLDYAYRSYRITLKEKNSALKLVLEEMYYMGALEDFIEVPSRQDKQAELLKEGLSKLTQRQKSSIYSAYNTLLETQKKELLFKKKLIDTENAYSKKWSQSTLTLDIAMEKKDLEDAGFYIEQDTIQLKDEQKLFLANRLDSIVEENISEYTEIEIKHLAIALMLELDELVDFTPRVQLAIESSNAVQIGYIAPHFTSTAKAGWARQIIEGMHENKKRASHRLAKNLITYYRVPLSETIIQMFEEEFGADTNFLRSLRYSDHREKKERTNLSELTSFPPLV